MLQGDIYHMQERVKEEYPNHEIVYAGLGHYNVIEKRRQLRYEGDLNGCPLFSMVEVADVVFEFDHIPDMRVLRHLREIDLWRHPRGPMGWYDEWERETEQNAQRREQKRNDEFDYVARDIHRNVMNELDGMKKSTFHVG